jgi:hypothetical protein
MISLTKTHDSRGRTGFGRYSLPRNAVELLSRPPEVMTSAWPFWALQQTYWLRSSDAPKVPEKTIHLVWKL